MQRGAFFKAAAAIPDFVPVEYKLIAVSTWLAGILGFRVAEALGGQAPTWGFFAKLLKIQFEHLPKLLFLVGIFSSFGFFEVLKRRKKGFFLG